MNKLEDIKREITELYDNLKCCGNCDYRKYGKCERSKSKEVEGSMVCGNWKYDGYSYEHRFEDLIYG